MLRMDPQQDEYVEEHVADKGPGRRVEVLCTFIRSYADTVEIAVKDMHGVEIPKVESALDEVRSIFINLINSMGIDRVEGPATAPASGDRPRELAHAHGDVPVHTHDPLPVRAQPDPGPDFETVSMTVVTSTGREIRLRSLPLSQRKILNGDLTRKSPFGRTPMLEPMPKLIVLCVGCSRGMIVLRPTGLWDRIGECEIKDLNVSNRPHVFCTSLCHSCLVNMHALPSGYVTKKMDIDTVESTVVHKLADVASDGMLYNHSPGGIYEPLQISTIEYMIKDDDVAMNLVPNVLGKWCILTNVSPSFL